MNETLGERMNVGFEQTNVRLGLLNEKWSFLNNKVEDNNEK